jgi:hypothetical protein
VLVAHELRTVVVSFSCRYKAFFVLKQPSSPSTHGTHCRYSGVPHAVSLVAMGFFIVHHITAKGINLVGACIVSCTVQPYNNTDAEFMKVQFC